MQTNDHQIRDYDIVHDAKFGKTGTPEREQALDNAGNFYGFVTNRVGKG